MKRVLIVLSIISLVFIASSAFAGGGGGAICKLNPKYCTR